MGLGFFFSFFDFQFRFLDFNFARQKSKALEQRSHQAGTKFQIPLFQKRGETCKI